ncbi:MULTISPECIES: outer membrane beta-barrel protein [Marinobacter]|uniref:outer membrane beta-barrel protein n=2 Tax=Marinobacteraceae TaxID=2887365 RepID=UPI002942A400|nr:outer membrane beta-barrel protein [Marinobacter salarius]WOI17648.1 outer membrane beta-barrel protein [Marinobacter salarius]
MAKLIGPWKCPPSITAAALAFCVLPSQPVLAEPLTLSGGLTNRYSDNITRDSDNEISDVETRANLRLSHQTDPGQCEANTYADLGYGIWHDTTYDPETYTTLDFQGDCELTTGLRWEVADNLRDVTRDTRGNDTPDNTTRKNVFRTGPVYALRLSNVDQLRFSLQYEDTEFEEPEETDSDRYIGSVGWSRMFSPTFSGGVSVQTNQAEFDTGAEIDTDVVSLDFSQTWATTSLSGSVGVSEIESSFGGNSTSSDGLVGDISLERQINPVTTFYINGSREFTDQTSDFDIRFDDFVFDLREISEVEVTAINTGIRRQFSDSSQLNVNVFANRSDYIRVDEKEDRLGLAVNYQRPVLPLLTLQSSARYQYQSFDEDDVDEETISLEVGLTYELTRDLGITGRIGHTSESSDLSTSEYDENWVSLGLDYRFF